MKRRVPGEPELRGFSLCSRPDPAMVYNTYIMMRRTQIYLDDRQRRKLDHVAKRTRRTVSELIREAIDARYAAAPKEDFLDALRAGTFGVWKDRHDLGRTDRYVRRVRRGDRIDRLGR
jgi:predicted DNA-binding protein